MSARRVPAPLSARRAEAQRRLARQRRTIADAWTEFESREARGERRLRRAVAVTREAWTLSRRVARLTALLSTGLALRRLPWRGLVGRAFGKGRERHGAQRKRR